MTSAGVSAGWAAVYGPLFLGLAWIAVAVLAWGGDELSEASVPQLVVVTWWALLGVVLSLAAPTWITGRARRKVEDTIRKESRSVTRAPWDGDFLQALESRGLLFDYMVTGDTDPKLTARTLSLMYVATPA